MAQESASSLDAEGPTPLNKYSLKSLKEILEEIDTANYIRKGMRKFHGDSFDFVMDATLYEYVTHYKDFLYPLPLKQVRAQDPPAIEFLRLCRNERRNWEKYWQQIKQERKRKKKMEKQEKKQQSSHNWLFAKLSQWFEQRQTVDTNKNGIQQHIASMKQPLAHDEEPKIE